MGKRAGVMHRLAAGAAMVVLAGCGGGGKESSPPPVQLPPTGGTPNPSPTPTPSATRFLVVTTGGTASLVWLDVNGNATIGDNGDSLAFTNLAGEFGRGIAQYGTQNSIGTLPASPLYRMQARGIDSVSGLVFSGLTAPVGATVISPLSTLVAAHGSEAAVRSALGLSSGADALNASTNLLTFDPVAGRLSSDAAIARDAARITSLNLQLLSLAAVLRNTNGDPVDSGVSVAEGARYLAELIAATGSANLTDKAVILQLLGKSRYQYGGTPEQRDAMASLLARYFVAVPARIEDERMARAWMLAFRFFVLADMDLLSRSWPNRAAAPIAAITTADIAAAARFYEYAPIPALGELNAVPDVFELHGDLFVPFQLVLNSCSSRPHHPSCNDYEMHGGFGTLRRITAVAAGEANTIELFLDSDKNAVTIRRIGNYTGTTWFNYAVTSPSGASVTGRSYVRVRSAP